VFLDGFPGSIRLGIAYDALASGRSCWWSPRLSRRPRCTGGRLAHHRLRRHRRLGPDRARPLADLGNLLRLQVDDFSFAVLRVAASAAVILAIAPHVVRPLQSFRRCVLVLGLVGALLVRTRAAGASITAWVVALVADDRRLAFGTSRAPQCRRSRSRGGARRPGERLSQRAGVFVAREEDADGSLLVKVYDATHDSSSRRPGGAALQTESPRVRLSRLEAVESRRC
jgi:hypothetical protein